MGSLLIDMLAGSNHAVGRSGFDAVWRRSPRSVCPAEPPAPAQTSASPQGTGPDPYVSGPTKRRSLP